MLVIFDKVIIKHLKIILREKGVKKVFNLLYDKFQNKNL